VTDLVGNALFRIDPATNQVAGSIALGAPSAAMPMAVAVSGDAVWVASNTLASPSEGMVFRVDPTSKSVVATIPVGSGALDIAAGAGAVWVISARDGTVSRIDPATNSVTATVHVGVNPGGIGVGAGAVWVADYLGAALVRLDQTTGQVVATVKLAGPARKVAVSPDAVWVIVADALGAIGTLVRVDPKTNAIVASIPLDADPWSVASTASRVWVAAKRVSDAIWVDPATNTIGGRVAIGGESIGVDVSSSTAWFVGQTPAEVVRIDFSGVTQGPPAAAPPVTATPSPTPSPAASGGPLSGGTLFVGTYFALGAPAGWTVSPSSSGNVTFHGPGVQLFLAHSASNSLTLDEVTAQIIANLRPTTGDPQQTEAISIDDVPGRLLTYHFSFAGLNRYLLDAFCVKNGRAYEINFNNVPGTESADRALFLDVLGSFTFLSAAG
jgi:YVTN family beta-propeller protein